MGWPCGTYGERRRESRIFVGKSEGIKPLGRPRRVWEHNIIMDLQEVVCGRGMDSSGSQQGLVAGCCE